MMLKHWSAIVAGTLALVALVAAVPHAQVGKGLIDPNVAAATELAPLPHMTPAIVKAMMEKRPFMSITALHAFLLAQKLTAAQAEEFYRKEFVHDNPNTGTQEEIVLIPGEGTRMAREFMEYRPWKTWAQFDKE